jgi:hypothetical protein
MVARHKSRRSRSKLIRRPKRRPDVPGNVGLFAGYHVSFAQEPDDAFDLAEHLASHEPGDDASGAGEDAVPNDGADRASEGGVRSSTEGLALRPPRNGEHLRSSDRKIDFDFENDVLPRICEVASRIREPKRYYLGVRVFPKEGELVRVVADSMAPTTHVSTRPPREGPPSPRFDQHGLKPRRRLRPQSRDE